MGGTEAEMGGKAERKGESRVYAAPGTVGMSPAVDGSEVGSEE